MNLLTQRAVVLSALALLTGCGSGTARVPVPPPPSVGPLPAVRTVEQITRPTDRYVPRFQEVRTLISAGNVLNARCMARFGLRGGDTHPTNIDRHGSLVAVAHTRLYGFFDPAAVADHGYDLVQLQSSQDPGKPARVPMSDTAKSVEIGLDDTGRPVTSYAGKPVPAGGCKAEAEQGTGGALPDMNAAGLPGGGPPVPLDDPRIVRATKQWSACMAAKGFHFSTPYDAMNSPVAQARVTGTGAGRTVVHSPAEIRQATTDLACKEATDFMATAVAVQAAYDQRYIDGHRTALTRYRHRLDERVAAAARVVAAAGNPPLS